MKGAKGPKAVKLVFTMGIDQQKIATALSAVSGAKAEVVGRFHDLLLTGMGGKMQRGEELTLEWDGPAVMVAIRGKGAGSIRDKALADGLLDLYLGPNAVSPSLKADVGAHLG